MATNQQLVGIDIGGTTVKIGLVRRGLSPDDLAVTQSTSIPSQPGDAPDMFAQRIAAAVKSLIQSSGADVAGAGIGCPGLIDPIKGLVRKSPNLPNLPHFPLRDRLAELLNLGVEIQNDANAAALGEWLYGPNEGVDNLIMITLGTGVGGGVICDDRLLSGADNAAGELGHVKVQFVNGAPCGCGKTGCLEAYAGAAGVQRIAREHFGRAAAATSLKPDALTTKDLSAAAERGDELARKILAQVGHYIGRGLATFIDIFNPQVIVIGGGASAAFDLLKPGMDAALDIYATFPETRARCRIERSAFPDDINVLGAAATYLNLHRS
jgi:glucokinase